VVFINDFDVDRRKLRLPRAALKDLQTALVPEGVPSDRLLCLSVVLDDSALNLREFAAYLGLIDNTYGRLSPQGIFAYSQRRERQLKIHRLGSRSVELKFVELITNTRHIQALLFTFLMLKYLPGVIESLSTAYRNYEEGRLLRERRKMLRHQIRDDSDLDMLSRGRKEQLITVIDELLIRGRRFLPKASRFARTYVRRVSIRIVTDTDTKCEADQKEKHV